MSTLEGFWQFLNTDVRKIPWGELTEKGIEAVTATKDFGEAFGEQAPNIKQLKPYLSQVEPFLRVLDAPVTQLAVTGLPFVSIGIGLLKMYLELSNIEPTYESAVIIAAQLAYLQSLETVLQRVSDETLKAKLQTVSLKALVEKQLHRLDNIQLNSVEAKTVTGQFPESELAKQFSEALAEQLKQAELDDRDVQRLIEQVRWGTHRHLHQAIAESGDSVEPLAEVYRTGGQQVQDRYNSIDMYLEETIASLPDGQVFDEEEPLIRFRDIYVPLMIQPLTQSGEVAQFCEPISIHDWALSLLEEPTEQRKVMFIEGEAGRGKSVFCRMFADLVQRELEFSYIPLLIRLRNIRVVANNLTETLEDSPDLEQVSFVRGNTGWLANHNTRFLIILDGFDELLLEGRATGGLKEFLQQVADFQERSHHQCIVTGRPLALQGVAQLITQTKGLERVRLEPMNNDLRNQWLAKWQAFFGETEVEKFRRFIDICPKEIADSLAREPLLLYLLARLHREKHLSYDMFSEVTGEANQQIQAKLLIYRESVNWVLEKQRQDENLRLAGLEDLDDLREVLQEAALCVVQSGNETARLDMLKHRFQDTTNPVAKLLQDAKDTIGQSDDKTLNNLLTTFYLKPGEGDKRGSVEFAHKSFGEYLFAERLKIAFKGWTALNEKKRDKMSDRDVNGQIYDLLGYGGLSVEIVEYLFELLLESDIDQGRLFNRLHEFYRRWYDGEFLDQPPNENLPQKKLLQLREQSVSTGLKQVDVFAGLNVMILLFKLHAAARSRRYLNLSQDALKPEISFYPCGEPDSDMFDENRLLNVIHYADSLGQGTFSRQVGPHLSAADLSNSNLYKADLSTANLYEADLFGANLYKADISSTNLSSADLSTANLYKADISSANLSGADLSSANLYKADLSSTNLSGADLSSAKLHKADLSSTNLSSADLSSVNLYRADLSNADLSSANLFIADLDRTNLYRTNLDSANFSDAILLEADLRQTTNLIPEQFISENLPLMCGVLLPPDIKVDPNRDWDQLPTVLHRRYPGTFETIETAEKFVNERRQFKA